VWFSGSSRNQDLEDELFPNVRFQHSERSTAMARLATMIVAPKLSLEKSDWKLLHGGAQFTVAKPIRGVVQLRDTRNEPWCGPPKKKSSKNAADDADGDDQNGDTLNPTTTTTLPSAPSHPKAESPPEELIVRILRPNEPPQEGDIRYTSNGSYDIQFTIMKTGFHTIEVRLKQNNSFILLGDPQQILIHAGAIDPTQCVMRQFNFQPHLVNEQYTCEIETCDSHGNQRDIGGDVQKFRARFANDSQEFSSALFQDDQNGKYSMIYVLTTPGVYELEILYDNQPCFPKQNFTCCSIEPSTLRALNDMVSSRSGSFQPKVIDDQKRKSIYLRVSSRQISIKKYISLYFVELFPKTIFSSRIHRVKLKFTNPNMLTLKDGIRKIKIKDKDSLTIAALILKFKFESGETFDDKQAFFKAQLLKDCPPIHNTSVIKFPRDRLLKKSCNQFNRASSRFWRTYLQFRFEGEEGIDAGGLYREFFNIACSQLFSTNPPHPSIDSPALFKKFENGYIFFDENASTPAAKDLLRCAGKICAKMLYDHILISQRGAQLPPVSLSPLFFKHLLQLPVEAEDLQFSSQASIYKHFMEMNLDDPDMREAIGDPTFTVEHVSIPPGGGAPTITVHPLVPNGARKPVTNANKELYLGLLANYELHEKVQVQIDTFLAGFFSVLPPDSLTQFDPEDLELLMCGVTEIDVTEMQRNCQLKSGLNSRTKEVLWFWRAVSSFSPVQKSKLLGFITGSTSLPAGGFSSLNPRLQIQPAGGTPNSLPRSHTCFHMLDLPRYTSFQRLLQALNTAIEFGSEGFGMA